MHWISWIEYSADFMKFCAVPAGFFELLPDDTREWYTNEALKFVKSKRWWRRLSVLVALAEVFAVSASFSFYIVPIFYFISIAGLFFYILSPGSVDNLFKPSQSFNSDFFKREKARVDLHVIVGLLFVIFIPILFAYIIQLFLDGDLKEISEFLFTPYNEFTQWTHTSRFRIFDYLFPDINLEKGIKRLVGIRRWFDERGDLVGSLMFLSPKLLSVITILFLQIAMFLYGLSVFLALIILSFVGLMKASNLLKEKFSLEKKRIPLIAFVIYCSGEIIGFAISTIRFLGISP